MMSSGQQVTAIIKQSRWVVYCLLCMVLGSSCIPSVKKAMKGKTFVFQTNIEVTGKMPAWKKRDLAEKLQNQLDDSLKVRVVSYAGLFKTYVRPPLFDSANIGRSKVFMTALMKSLGYFQSAITDTFYFRNINNRNRTYVTFKVSPGVQLKIDSVGYALNSPELQQLALEHRNRSSLKKNDAYTTDAISSEIDRLLTSFRDNGFYKITRESVYAEVDTVVAALIDPTLDPFEQIRLLDSLQRKRDKPTINVVFKQRETKDSTHLMKFHIGDVSVYPDLYLLEDSSWGARRDTATIDGYKFFYYSKKFKLPFIAENIFLSPGSLYRQRRYYRTINNFNQLGPWQNVDLDLHERYDSVPLLDATLRLYPAKKQSLTVDVEASRNVSDFLTNGRFFGIGLNFRLLNRNAYREAIQTSTNARFGIELGTNLVQTLQTSFSHNIYFPKFILPFRLDEERVLNPRTVLALEAAYTNRREFFQVPSFKASWGYEWTSGRVRGSSENPRRRINWQYIPLNFEYTSVIKTDSLRKLERQISAYRFAFNDGMIISQVLSANTVFTKNNRLTVIQGRIEESGGIFGLIRELELGDLRRFVKMDAEVKHMINFNRSSLAFRAYGGVGFIYGSTRDTNGVVTREKNLPFFKAFASGGPYSMRAWQIRRLGPGSSTLYEATDTTSAIDRFGNMKIEFNAEYRFNLTTIAGIKVASALFIDVGNIWSKETDLNGDEIKEASFKLNRLYKDLAVGGGTSLRFDFDFFLIRLDWAYKLKNPVFAGEKSGWFHKIDIGSGQFQLGIGYPF